MNGYLVNHVMSREIESGIFTAIMAYFTEYSPAWVRHEVSNRPIAGADVYHYHRPQLESRLERASVCTVHHDLDDPDVWHGRYRFIPRYNEAASVICLNETQRAILRNEGIAASRLHVVPHGYNHKVLRAKSLRDITHRGKTRIGVASRRYGRRVKGEAYFMELAKRLDPDAFEFILVGQDRSIDALMLRGLGFEVRFFERLPYRVFQGFYDSIDVLLMCSSHEGGPANIPEALGTGTPVFASAVGMARDMIRSGENGVLLSLNPDADAEQIRRTCVELPERLEHMKACCLAERSSVLTWGHSVAGNLSVYSQVIGHDVLVRPDFISEVVSEALVEEA